MRWWASATSRLRQLFRRSRLDRDNRDEFKFHLEHRAGDLMTQGLTADEAMRRARIEFGGATTYLEEVRAAWSFCVLEEIGQDLRYALRALTRSPGFAIVVVLSLALGIGANSAIFSLADAVLLRPLPVQDPGAFVTIGTSAAASAFDQPGVSYANYRDLRARSASFDGMVAYSQTMVSVARASGAVRDMRLGMVVSGGFFETLGIRAAMGRTFRTDEGEGREALPVVVLAYDYWRSAEASDPSIVGHLVWINGVACDVVGVAPQSFTGMDQYIRPALFVPVSMAEVLGLPHQGMDDRVDRSFMVKGRLRPGVSQAAAARELKGLWATLVAEHPDVDQNLELDVRSEFETRVRASPPDAILVGTLMALACLVLIVACANVANLMLGRAVGRTREMAIRLSLGVSRPRLFRQLLTESLTLAALGCVVALPIAFGGIRFLQRIQVPSDLPIVIAPRLDIRVLVFSGVAALMSAALFGLAPAWRSLQTRVVPALKVAPSGQTMRRRVGARQVLVVAQVALSMVLLVATGLILAGFHDLLGLDPGFRTTHLITVSFDTALVQDTPAETHVFYRALKDRARDLPGVGSVALTGAIPLDPVGQGGLVVPEGYQFPPGQTRAAMFMATVDEDYFATMQTPLLRGRPFTADDKAGAHPVAIVNEEFASRFWPGQDPLGKRLRLADADGGPWCEVVGVAKTGKYAFIGETPAPFVYLPWAQNERTRMSLLVETDNPDPGTFAAPLRDLVRSIDVNQPVFDVRTMSDFYAQRAIAIPRTILRVVAAMGLLALLLTLIGLYAVIAHSVAGRTREIGIRMAVGAGRSEVQTLVLIQGLKLSLVGIALGGLASIAAARLLVAAMAGIGDLNRGTYVVVPIMLFGLALAASYIPARRASSIDPIRAVRQD